MRRTLLTALAGLALTACAAAAVTLASSESSAPGGPATLVGRYVWSADLAGLGGLSAIELSPDGLDATLVSDRTLILRARLARDPSGAVTAVEATAPVDLLGEDGRVLRGLDADSEGLAIDDAGHEWVGFEGRAAVRRLGPPGWRSTRLPAAPEWADLPINLSLEALAVDASGALYAIPEQPEGDAVPVWRLALGGTEWEVVFRLPRRDGFRVTGADIGPDGRLTILERRFNGLSFHSRVRRVALDGTGEATLWTSRAGEVDNLEGIAVWRDESGAYGGGLRATMVSDDNFRFVQQTQLVDLRLPD